MVAITAQQILDENNYDEAQISKTNLEYLIDNCINWVNLVAGQSMSNMSGTAGSKTVTVTSNQSAVLKFLIPLIVKAYLDRGPNASVATVSVGVIAVDPQTGQFRPMYKLALQMLRRRSFERV